MSMSEISSLLPVLTARRSVELNAAAATTAEGTARGHNGGVGGSAATVAAINEARHQLEAAQQSVVKVSLLN